MNKFRNLILVINPCTNNYYYKIFGHPVSELSTEEILKRMGLGFFCNEDTIFDMYECDNEELCQWVKRLENSNVWYCAN